AEQSGLIDGQARQLFKDMPYVPFYRVMEGGVEGPSFSSGLVNQRAWKKLKGGTQKLNEDLLSNVLLNWAHLFDASGKNRAAVASMQAATQIGIAQPVAAGTKGAVKVMEQGQTKHYVIDDPYVMEAVTALNYQPPGFFQPFSTVKKWLTIGVTASPTFKIKNLMRDSLQAIGTAPMSYNVASNVMRGFKQGSQETQTFASMLAGGGLIRFGSMLEGTSRTQYMIERQGGILLNEGGWKKLQRQMTGLVEAYAELGDRLENVNRVSLYEHLVSKGYSQAEANFMSRDLMDFSLQGRWPVVRFLAQSVPFLNARLQGLSKLGRGAKDDTRRFGYVVGAVALASIALMLAYEDDEDWKKRPDWDRDSNWWFKIGDTAFRIPKPFEIGAIGTVAERTWEVAFNDEMSWKRYRQRLSHMIFETFAMDPTPQLVVPISEIYANKEGFTQRPIEGLGLQKLRPEDRATERTSSVARLLGQMGLPSPVSLVKGDYEKLSPVQIDHLIRGYFGWIGSTATTILDFGLRPLMDRGERPAYRLKDVFVVGNFAEGLPANSSRYVDQLYEQARIIEQAYMSYQDAKKKGDRERMRELVAEDGNKIKAYKSINKISRQVSEINRKIRQIESSKTLSADTK
ncbi:MAG: LPD38 domain-containing protein, partial [Burkholderiaceae bacterium]